jgi:DNA-binding MarR family transcriptional regulator
VRRARTATDRRQVLCHIEKKGLDLLSRLDATTAESREAIFTGVTKAELASLISTLAAIRKACAARCPSLKKH